MTTNILAIDENMLICPACHNTDPKRFKPASVPEMHQGVVCGYRITHVVCGVCQTSIGFEHAADSACG